MNLYRLKFRTPNEAGECREVAEADSPREAAHIIARRQPQLSQDFIEKNLVEETMTFGN